MFDICRNAYVRCRHLKNIVLDWSPDYMDVINRELQYGHARASGGYSHRVLATGWVMAKKIRWSCSGFAGLRIYAKFAVSIHDPLKVVGWHSINAGMGSPKDRLAARNWGGVIHGSGPVLIGEIMAEQTRGFALLCKVRRPSFYNNVPSPPMANYVPIGANWKMWISNSLLEFYTPFVSRFNLVDKVSALISTLLNCICCWGN